MSRQKAEREYLAAVLPIYERCGVAAKVDKSRNGHAGLILKLPDNTSCRVAYSSSPKDLRAMVNMGRQQAIRLMKEKGIYRE